MFEFAAMTYGVLASFIMTSMQRNRRAARGHSAVLSTFGWGMMSFSMAAGVMLLAYATYQALSGTPVGLPPIA